MIFCLNGKFTQSGRAKVSVLDNGFLYGDGFYDTMRIYDGVVFELDLHLQRIAKSAWEMGLLLPWSPELIGRWIRRIVTVNRLTDARIRVTVTRGVHGMKFGIEHRPMLVITCAEIRNPAINRDGIRACTMKLQRLWPKIKTLGLMAMVISARYATRHSADEIIGISADGKILGGASTNIFLVKNGRLLTPKIGRILPGLTRKRVLALARKARLPVLAKNLPRSALKSADEIFLTNRVREIVPVVRLNGKKIGSGRVGPITKKMMAAYREYVHTYVERHKDEA